MKKKIIHFIFNLGRGGAETMLVTVIKHLPEYEHIVVTLRPANNFGDELQCSKLICLNMGSLVKLPAAVLKFRRLVKKEQPAVVHTHLFWPTLTARFAVPKKIPLFTTIHAFISKSVEYKKWYVRFLDKLSYRLRPSTIIGVAKDATAEYFSYLQLKPGKYYTLHTFVDMARFKSNASIKPPGTFKVIAVGALRVQKNYLLAVKAFEKIKQHNIELHIYGSGDMEQEIQTAIDKTGAKIFLKGEVKNMEAVLPQYHLFLMTSSYEGFSLSVLEAMAMEVPLLLSDIPSFKEQAADTAEYFSLEDDAALANKIIAISQTSESILKQQTLAAKQRVENFFTLPAHIQKLREIYNAV
jgi:glycosyltransferase involved in cell wall biosynthesis